MLGSRSAVANATDWCLAALGLASNSVGRVLFDTSPHDLRVLAGAAIVLAIVAVAPIRSSCSGSNSLSPVPRRGYSTPSIRVALVTEAARSCESISL